MVETERRFLRFDVEERSFALPLSCVLEILRAAAAAALPRAPAIVEGVLSLRGRVVPVLDVRSRFDLPPRPVRASDHMIVARAGARTVAIRVDRAVDLVSLPEGGVEKIESVVPGARHVAGVGKLPDGVLVIHDLAAFLSQAEGEELDQALEARGEGAP